jgi:diketogulonate reductase-like aldo/keto reductase
MDKAVPDARFVDQLGALIIARDDGLIGGIGISNVSLDHLTRATEVTEIVCVQNYFNIAARDSQPILDACNARGIAFVPFCPLGFPRAQRESIVTNGAVNDIAAAHDATAVQIALAWLLAIAPNVLLIAGTRTRTHLTENIAAFDLSLSDRDIALLDQEFTTGN